MRNHYNCIEPLMNLYHGIRLNNMELINSNVKSINQIINPTDEVKKAYESIKSINKKIEEIL